MLEPRELIDRLDELETIEQITTRMITQALFDFRMDAKEIFSQERDLEGDIGEDVTREALDRMGIPRIAARLFGKVDYKRAAYVFLPHHAIRQALFVDSRSEMNAQNVARIQITQTSMTVRQIIRGSPVEMAGLLPTVYPRGNEDYLSTTVFVKYSYRRIASTASGKELKRISIFCLPNGMLQDRYNPTADILSIWNVGPDAPTRGEAFRTRINLSRLRARAPWRVQVVMPEQDAELVWNS